MIHYLSIPTENPYHVDFKQNNSSSRFIATHAAISVPLSREEIEELGKREGWRVAHCNHEGIFEVMVTVN